MRNKMYKKVMIAMVAGALAMSAVGCQKQNETKTVQQGAVKSVENKQPEKKVIDVAALADKIVKEGSFKDELNKIEDDMFSSIYESVETSLVAKSCAYTGSGATAEQVVVVEAKDADSAKKVKDQLDEKVKDDIEQDKDYLPNEIPKLNSAVLKTSDKYVILVVSDDNSKAEGIVNKECE